MSAMQQASDPAAFRAPSSLPLLLQPPLSYTPPWGVAGVSTAATVASVYPCGRLHPHAATRQHSRATFAGLMILLFIIFLALPLSLALSCSHSLSLLLSLPAFLCVLTRIIRARIYRACALDSGAFSHERGLGSSASPGAWRKRGLGTCRTAAAGFGALINEPASSACLVAVCPGST